MITPAPREKLSLTLNDREPVRPIVSILVSTAKSRPSSSGPRCCAFPSERPGSDRRRSGR